MLSAEHCHRAMASKDPRFDGWFYIAVVSTGIYCRPSCPASPKASNVRFYPTAAAAQGAGFRACKRCRPDASPGSPEWSIRADVVGRAMRLIADGVVDRDGVSGLARRIGYSERQLNRALVAEVGAGALALARAQRARTARILLETTGIPITEVAFASGFTSVRSFNETIRQVFATTPTELRRGHELGAGPITLRLAYREPLDIRALFSFLAARAVPGIEHVSGSIYSRSLSLPHGAGVIRVADSSGHLSCTLHLDDMRDLTAAVQRTRRLFDLDADPAAIDELLRNDPLIGAHVRAAPGRRVPGAADVFEVAVRAIIGQQVSVAAARTVAGRIVQHYGKPLTSPVDAVTHLWPDAATLAEADENELPMPLSRAATIQSLAGSVAGGDIQLDPGADRDELRTALRSIRGIGEWTAEYVAMRGLGDPDAFLASDLGILRALAGAGRTVDAAGAKAIAERWRPWRAYASQHLWALS
jgi:AraC family transcriptional regulator, regulatory protein of adaptative response / DNA-3-methyladenine glycosylase II